MGDVLEVASGLYQAGDWTRARRLVVVRERAAVGPAGQLLDLPAILAEQFIATTQDWDEEDIWHWVRLFSSIRVWKYCGPRTLTWRGRTCTGSCSARS